MLKKLIFFTLRKTNSINFFMRSRFISISSIIHSIFIYTQSGMLDGERCASLQFQLKMFYLFATTQYINRFTETPCFASILPSTRFLAPVKFSRYYYVGLGYKIFVFENTLFISVGLTHYTLISVPLSVRVFPKKRRIYILGKNEKHFQEFLATIRRVRKIDIYKGKGLLEVKTYKGFLKMKSGKKKQY